MAEEGNLAHPPYPEMILSAIDALNDPTGSNKTNITKQIESMHGDLSAGHGLLVSHHLNKMRYAGELIFAKNKYLRPKKPPMADEATPAHPPLPEMILNAIDALNEPNGSNKTAITKQIASVLGDLPQDYAKLISDHLKKMKDAGEIKFVRNNYLRPDPNTPSRKSKARSPKSKTPSSEGDVAKSPKRKGRPPKPKTLSEGDAAKSPKAKGRPPKPKDPLAAAVAKASEGFPKLKGRPRKKVSKIARKNEVPPPLPTGKRRGRPPKAKSAVNGA